MASDNMKMKIPYPVPTAHHAAVLGAYHLALDLAAPACKVRVPGRAGELFLEDWAIARAAFVSRMASTLRHLGYLVPSMSRLDGAALCRTLLDHAITYAWIAHDPADHLPRFLRSTYDEALKHHRRYAEYDEALLEEWLLEHYEAFIAQHRGTPGNLRALAKEADAAWLERARAAAPPPLVIPSLEQLYVQVYAPFANLDHPSPAGLQTFVHLDPGSSAAWVDGEPERERDMDLRPYWLALWSFFWALTVASLTQGQPRLGELQSTWNLARTVREYDRHDLLRASTADGLVQLDVVADIDQRIADIQAARNAATDDESTPTP